MLHKPDVFRHMHENDNSIFGKVCLKTGMHMNFYFIVKLSIHYNMTAFIIVWHLHV